MERSGGEEAPQDGGWTAAPRIRAVEREGAGLIVHGEAPPGARVVLRGGQDAAFAAGADAFGRFDVRVGAPSSPMLLTPEVQIGQFTAPGPERLMLVGKGTLFAAMLVEGGASRRLSAGPALDSVDGDGRGVLVSGRAAPGARLTVSGGGGAAVEVSVDPSGRWTAALTNIGDHPTSIHVGDRSFAYPGPAGEEAVGRIERAGAGWRLTRALSSSARQTSWFPDV
ncbi:hypothetical protein [Brevundimonas sp.]|uniref:hypothetical protein n=1 Tax=Brevundimonas sp. TaxID=1871086 RepID=UPI002EDABAD9